MPENPETQWTSDVYKIGMETKDILIYIQFPFNFNLLTSILTKNSALLIVV